MHCSPAVLSPPGPNKVGDSESVGGSQLSAPQKRGGPTKVIAVSDEPVFFENRRNLVTRVNKNKAALHGAIGSTLSKLKAGMKKLTPQKRVFLGKDTPENIVKDLDAVAAEYTALITELNAMKSGDLAPQNPRLEGLNVKAEEVEKRIDMSMNTQAIVSRSTAIDTRAENTMRKTAIGRGASNFTSGGLKPIAAQVFSEKLHDYVVPDEISDCTASVDDGLVFSKGQYSSVIEEKVHWL